MEGTDNIKDQVRADRNSANSTNSLIIDNYYNDKNLDDEQLSDQSQISTKKTKESSQKSKKKTDPSLPQIPADRPSFRGPFGITIASTVLWYICICILFVIAFLCLVLSTLYFVSDTTKETVIKLYGICGSGTLAIVTVVIIFLDCCSGRSKKDHENEAIYKMLQAKEARDKAMALRRSRRIAEGKEERPKPFTVQHQQSQKVSSVPHPYHHHVHAYPPTSYHHPFVCPVCHDLHASGNARHNLTDIGVDTSDKFAPVSKSKKIIHKSTRDAQTEPKIWDIERGTQTDRTEGTQTSTMELSGMPNNITQIIHETTIVKGPRNLLSTIKKSMAQQDKDIAINRAVTDTNTMTAAII